MDTKHMASMSKSTDVSRHDVGLWLTEEELFPISAYRGLHIKYKEVSIDQISVDYE